MCVGGSSLLFKMLGAQTDWDSDSTDSIPRTKFLNRSTSTSIKQNLFLSERLPTDVTCQGYSDEPKMIRAGPVKSSILPANDGPIIS
jgi:hypothetical protein